ncbi:MAG: sigma-70 family RNA polymerase sigma factor [Clostridia bacterium]|nr:sigma-70 family RNA polymerase sigma factor [Clostridia bacterium]
MKDELILKNTKLIYLAIKKLNLYNRLDELYSVGMIGLVKGAKEYNKSLGYSASTYLYKCIYNEILWTIRNEKSKRRIPEYKKISLSISIDENITLEDVIADETDIEEELIKQEQIKNMFDEINKLSVHEQMVINYSFGLNGCEKMAQKEIGEILDINQASVSRIKNKALKKLKEAMEEK